MISQCHDIKCCGIVIQYCSMFNVAGTYKIIIIHTSNRKKITNNHRRTHTHTPCHHSQAHRHLAFFPSELPSLPVQPDTEQQRPATGAHRRTVCAAHPCAQLSDGGGTPARACVLRRRRFIAGRTSSTRRDSASVTGPDPGPDRRASNRDTARDLLTPESVK